MGDIISNYGQILSQNIWLAFIAALAAGFISSFSPCVLSSVPLIIGYVGGYAGNNKKKAFHYSLFFCFGLIITFTALGAVSALLGQLMTGAGSWWYIILGIIMIVVGLQMLGIIKYNTNACSVPNRRKGLIGAFLLGIVGGVLSSPCATPVLAAILAFVAGQKSIILGISLLAVYSAGHCVLIIIAGSSVGFVKKLASSPGTEKWGKVLRILFGIMVIMLALYLFYIGF